MKKEVLFALAYGFKLNGKIVDIRPFGEGHINSTFVIETESEKYILQKINSYVFKDIDALMNNIDLVTKYIRFKGQESLEIIPTKEDKLYQKYKGKYYRVYVFVKDTVCYQKVTSLDLARSAGSSFGELHYILKDFPVNQIVEVIPNFHNTEKRFLDFLDAYSKAEDYLKEEAKEEIDYVLNHEYSYGTINQALKNGEVKVRVTHNDTKINNILFDKKTGQFRCVIDLDTVMPGSVLYDIGDAFRGMFTGENEDNPDLSKQVVDFNIYKEYIKAYLEKMNTELTSKEKELIPFSIYLMTIECGMRFLEDFLRGNVYFATKYRTHNLVRARTQIALAEQVLNNLDKLNQMTEEIINELN